MIAFLIVVGFNIYWLSQAGWDLKIYATRYDFKKDKLAWAYWAYAAFGIFCLLF